VLIGFSLLLTNAPPVAVVAAITVAIAGAVFLSGSEILAGIAALGLLVTAVVGIAFGIAWIKALTGDNSFVEAGAWTGPWAWALAGSWAWYLVVSRTEGRLLRSFNRFHKFLTLAGTSWLGLGMGWMLGAIFKGLPK
jgi:serine/threonine-protein kinase